MLNIRRETLGTIVILHSTTSSLPHWTMSSLRAKYFACSTVQQLPHAHNPLWNWDAMSFWAEKTQNQFSSVQLVSDVWLFATPWTAENTDQGMSKQWEWQIHGYHDKRLFGASHFSSIDLYCGTVDSAHLILNKKWSPWFFEKQRPVYIKSHHLLQCKR